MYRSAASYSIVVSNFAEQMLRYDLLAFDGDQFQQILWNPNDQITYFM